MDRIPLSFGRATAQATCLMALFLGVAEAGPQGAGISLTVDQVLDKYVQSLGGKEAVEKISTRVMKGALESPGEGTSSPAEIWAKAPAKYYSKADIADYGVVEEALDGDKGWTRNPDSGVLSMAASALAVAKRDYDFYREIRLKDHYAKMTVVGKDQVDDRDAFVVEVRPSNGSPEKLYFDAQSGLLLKREYERVTLEDGIIQFEVTFEDYREVDGVKVPFVVRRKTPDYTTIYRFNEVKFNVPVDDAKFQKPEK